MILGYCDGSGTVATGPACIGVTVFDASGGAPVPLVEASEYVGYGTNNVAELRALGRALGLVRWLLNRGAKVGAIYTDSEYARHAAIDSWLPKANADLVWDVRRVYDTVRGRVSIGHVAGHAGIAGNEIADWLAGRARAAWFAKQGITKTLRGRPSAPWEAAA